MKTLKTNTNRRAVRRALKIAQAAAEHWDANLTLGMVFEAHQAALELIERGTYSPTSRRALVAAARATHRAWRVMIDADLDMRRREAQEWLARRRA